MNTKIRFAMAGLLLLCARSVYGQDDRKSRDSTRRGYAVVRMCSPKYPRKAEINNIQGSVVVEFDMDSNCMYVNFRIIRSLGCGCDEEAIRAIKCRIVSRSGDKSNCKPQYNLRQTVEFVKPAEEE